MTNSGFISENMNYCTKIGSFQLMCCVVLQLVEGDCLRAQMPQSVQYAPHNLEAVVHAVADGVIQPGTFAAHHSTPILSMLPVSLYSKC